MLRAGYAKAFMPDAAVVHSHDYGPVAQFRRSFDEWRGLREVHGWVEPGSPRRATLLTIQSRVRADVRSLQGEDEPLRVLAREALRSLRHWTVRAAGAALGSRADRLPPRVRRWCSLERRASFEPSHDMHDPSMTTRPPHPPSPHGPARRPVASRAADARVPRAARSSRSGSSPRRCARRRWASGWVTAAATAPRRRGRGAGIANEGGSSRS